MKRLADVDILAALGEIMRQNTAFHQDDYYSFDIKHIARAAYSEDAGDKYLLWMARPTGTWCFKEQDVYTKELFAHNTWRFYAEDTRDRVLAYSIVVRSVNDGILRGDLYELDYLAHAQHVARNSIAPGTAVVHLDGGGRLEYEYSEYLYEQRRKTIDTKQVKRIEYAPADKQAMDTMLTAARKERAKLPETTLVAHVKQLRAGLVIHEAQRLAASLQKTANNGYTVNDGRGEQYVADYLSPHFLQLANSEDLNRLYVMMPYDSFTIRNPDREGNRLAAALKSEDFTQPLDLSAATKSLLVVDSIKQQRMAAQRAEPQEKPPRPTQQEQER